MTREHRDQLLKELETAKELLIEASACIPCDTGAELKLRTQIEEFLDPSEESEE